VTQVIRDHNRQVFDSLKQQVGNVFDGLLQKSKSIWSAIGDAFKSAMLNAIRDVVSSRVAAMLTQLFTGTKVTFASNAAAGGGMLGGLGGLLGAVPMFGAGGGIIPGVTMGTTPPFLGGGGLVGGAGGGLTGTGGWLGGGGTSGFVGFGGLLGNLKEFLGIGGSIQTGAGTATTWGAATLGQKLAAIGRSDAALLGGAMLALEGLHRGGGMGMLETTGGGALIGFKFGGPLGAAIGAGAGLLAGGLRWLFGGKAPEERMRDKIRDVYGINITDRAVLKQLVDMAKSSYGGDFDMAVRSAQVSELVELYAMSTGQKMPLAATALPSTMIQSGGSVYQMPSYTAGGQQYAVTSAFPALGGTSLGDRLTASGVSSGPTVVVPLNIDGKEVGRAIIQHGRVVTQGVLAGVKDSVGRRDMLSSLAAPGLLPA
jgi:hypothetical protein